MKRTFFLLFITIIAFYSCTKPSTEEEVKEQEIINEPPKNDEVVITVDESIDSFFTNLYIGKYQGMADMLLLGNKEGKSTITIPTTTYARIRGGLPFFSFHYDLTLDRGDSLFIEQKKVIVNPEVEIEYPLFTIPNSNRTWNELNFNYLLYKRNLATGAVILKKNASHTDYDMDKIYDNTVYLLDSLQSAEKISTDFYNLRKANQKFTTVSMEYRKAAREGKKIDVEELGVQLNDSAHINNSRYLALIRTMILGQYFKGRKRVPFSEQFDYVNENKTFLSNEFKERILSAYLRNIYISEKPKFEDYLAKFNQTNTNGSYREEWLAVATEEQQKKEKQKAGNKNIGRLTNLVDEEKDVTFEEVLSNNKGKLVLVDFWASWCAPCRAEMNPLKKLKSKFSADDLSVVEISTDEDYDAWVRAATMENLAGEEQSYIINNWTKSSLYETYNIKAIPRYLLFDRKGEIIDSNAPKPSNSDLEELIKENL